MGNWIFRRGKELIFSDRKNLFELEANDIAGNLTKLS